MKASDIMTSPVITVQDHTPVREIAALLLKHRISAVPVMKDGELAGIVSEGDLLHRHEIGTERTDRNGSWWLWLLGTEWSLGDYVRSHARYARDVMTRKVVSVTPDTPIAKIASLLEARGIKRVPVLRGKRLVGIVSRANLIQALAVAPRPASARSKRESDNAIRARLAAELERQPWWRRGSSSMIVSGGVVHYWGTIIAEEEKAAARVAAENVAGVRAVEDHRFTLYDIPYAV